MKLRVGRRTDVGMSRTENQDSLLVDLPLFLVADGMGGMRGGGTASALAVEVMLHHVPDLRDNPDPGPVLAAAVAEAHRRILEEGDARPELQGMGTTLTGVVPLAEGELVLVHVGDSRCYRHRDGVLELISEDDSYVGELVRLGQLTPEDAKTHPHRSLITKALGAGDADDLEPAITHVDARDGDRFLLCSDGLSTMLEDAEISQILRDYPDTQEVADQLVEAANARHSTDNVTVVVLDIVEGGGGGIELDGAAVTAASPLTAAEATSTIAVDERPAERRDGAGEGRRLLPRVVLIGAVAVMALLLLGLGGRWLMLRSWFIACDQTSNVAVYRGLPQGLLGFGVSRLDHVPQPPVSCLAAAPDLRERLERGIAVGGREEAEETVTNYREQFGPAPTATTTTTTTTTTTRPPGTTTTTQPPATATSPATTAPGG